MKRRNGRRCAVEVKDHNPPRAVEHDHTDSDTNRPGRVGIRLAAPTPRPTPCSSGARSPHRERAAGGSFRLLDEEDCSS